MSANERNVIKKPIVTFGVLSDVQYADYDDQPASYDPSKTRFYRGSLSHIDSAFNYWKNSSLKVKFVLQLGDIIDGLNHALGGSYSALCHTLSHFEKHSSIPTFHTVGNHELYNFDRKELAELFYESVIKINIPPEVFNPAKPLEDKSSLISPILYYTFSPSESIKCISLDCFDISVLGYNKEHPKYKEAAKTLSHKHGHDIFEDWDCSGPLEGLEVRFQQMNGAVGKEQLMWLDKELSESDEAGQKVVVFGHVSLFPDSTDWTCLLWNYDEVMKVFHQHKCVIAYLSGHTHANGYAMDSHGISYIIFTGIVEAPPSNSTFTTVSVYEDHLEVCGHGEAQSYVIPYRLHTSTGVDPVVDNEMGVAPTTVKVEV